MTNENCKEKVKFLLKIVKYFEKHRLQARILVAAIAMCFLILSASFGAAIIIQAQNNCFGEITKKAKSIIL